MLSITDGIASLKRNGVCFTTLEEAVAHSTPRQLLYYERIRDLQDKGLAGSELAIELMGHHMSIMTALVDQKARGCLALEVTLVGLCHYNEFYSQLAFSALQNGISLKFHIVLSSDNDNVIVHSRESLKAQLSTIVAMHVPFSIENFDSINDIELAHEIIEIVEEIHVDTAGNGGVNVQVIQDMLSRLPESRVRLDTSSSEPRHDVGRTRSYRIISS